MKLPDRLPGHQRDDDVRHLDDVPAAARAVLGHHTPVRLVPLAGARAGVGDRVRLRTAPSAHLLRADHRRVRAW